MRDEERAADYALAICYGISAVILIAMYREPLLSMARDFGRWYRAKYPSAPRSIRGLGGKLWSDVDDAVDNAG